MKQMGVCVCGFLFVCLFFSVLFENRNLLKL